MKIIVGTRGAVLKGHSFRRVENPCSKKEEGAKEHKQSYKNSVLSCQFYLKHVCLQMYLINIR